MKIVLFDHSFEGLLSAVFEVFHLKLKEAKLIGQNNHTASFFDEEIWVSTDQEKAARVAKGIVKVGGKSDLTWLYRCFLSELAEVPQLILEYIRQLMVDKHSGKNDFSRNVVIQLQKINKMIGREKHRMDAFVRFEKTADGLYFAGIAPDFNVLPLNAKHFKNRYADQHWCIYDVKRDYGLLYNLESLRHVHLPSVNANLHSTPSNLLAEDEVAYKKLWKNYFESTNIQERANKKLHTQHVPKRYWKYLSEKYILDY